MLDIKSLLPELKKLVTDLSADLLARSTAKDDPYSAEVDAGLREAYTQTEKGGRTADAFEVWREDYLDQVAVAWVLGCVFVRFMEDNHLIDVCWLAGDGERRKLTEDTHELYFREHPHESDREYFEHVFREVGKTPACRDLFAEGKTPLWAVGPSGDMAMKLLAFWREIDPDTGHLVRSFQVEDGDTRFLGDLYQDLSERARKKYALLQTPVFVEEFILDRTLDPAIDEFGLDEVRMIDPTCGSGHFLLGGFARLFDLWIKREDNEVVAAQKALDGVWGCDINPFAVAIARFRLIVAALRACGIKRLKDAPAWSIHLATGDSLLFGSRWTRNGDLIAKQKWLGEEESWAPEIYVCEDKEALIDVLGQQYHVVVGNPPYITAQDKARNKAYRKIYTTCHRKYSLAVPFTEKFFNLALALKNGRTGYVGMITANSFMNREFGKKLIEDFFAKTDLSAVINTSGAFIPGHNAPGEGTTTVVILGRNRSPVGDEIRAILAEKAEPGTPDDPAQGVVWRSIVENLDNPGFTNEFITSLNLTRVALRKYPWSLSGGAALQAKTLLESRSSQSLGSLATTIGYMSIAGEDDVYIFLNSAPLLRKGIASDDISTGIVGRSVRDWSVKYNSILYPHDEVGEYRPLASAEAHFWRYRTILRNTLFFEETKEQRGKAWQEFAIVVKDKLLPKRFIAFAEIASHNHFVLFDAPKLCMRTAPIVRLPDDHPWKDCLGVVGVLNSSVALFWSRQVFYPKGGFSAGKWEERLVFNSTKLKLFPLPRRLPERWPVVLHRLSTALDENSLSDRESLNEDTIADAKSREDSIRRQMIAAQEELDWETYYCYGMTEEDLTFHGTDLPEVQLGERAFEIVMARLLRETKFTTQWFDRHGSTPTCDVPQSWPRDYANLVERRIALLERDTQVQVIEGAEYKRRWSSESWESRLEQLVRERLLDLLCGEGIWTLSGGPTLRSVAEIADKVANNEEFHQLGAIYRGRQDFDIVRLVRELVEQDSVPLLPTLRLTDSGRRKHILWEKMWRSQRAEDRGEEHEDPIIPPKYSRKDFLGDVAWQSRGPLDVPTERFISFPNCETDSDPSLVVGWAGWPHLQQATAIVAYYDARKREGWDAKRLTPLLAALDQLIPWIHQWHPEVDPEFGETAGQSFQTMLEADAHELGLTLDEIRAWEPPKKTTTRRKRTKK